MGIPSSKVNQKVHFAVAGGMWAKTYIFGSEFGRVCVAIKGRQEVVSQLTEHSDPQSS